MFFKEEHKLCGDKPAEYATKFHRKGWRGAWAEAVPTDTGGSKAGAAILWKGHIPMLGEAVQTGDGTMGGRVATLFVGGGIFVDGSCLHPTLQQVARAG